MEAERLNRIRQDILTRMKPVVRAWSVNGRDVVFTADFETGAEIGGFITVTTPEGARLVVQVRDLRFAVRDSIHVDVDTSEFGDSGSRIQGANVSMVVRFVEGEGAVLGLIGPGGIVRAPEEGFSEGSISVSSDDEVSMLMSETLGSSAGLAVGRLSRANVGASLKASGFSRHSFLCGQSGSGKTYSMGVLLERLIVGTDLPLIIVDPNSDYVGLGQFRSRETINRGRSTPLSRSSYAALKSRYQARADVAVARSSGGDLPLRIFVSDLTLDEQALTIGLDPIADAEEFAAFVDATRAVGADRYGMDDVENVLVRRFDEASRRLAQRIGNLGIAHWSVWAQPGQSSLIDVAIHPRVLVLDTGSLSDARERSVIALALLGRLRRRANRTAVSVVIDEAHNVCSPNAPTSLERAVTDYAVWIAGEGRKFGIYLLLASQRPQKVHRNVISQCDNLLLMRVNSVADLDELAQVFSHVPPTMIAEARSFQLGEMLAAGPVASTPIRLRVGERWSPEGGADLPTTWASPSD